MASALTFLLATLVLAKTSDAVAWTIIITLTAAGVSGLYKSKLLRDQALNEQNTARERWHELVLSQRLVLATIIGVPVLFLLWQLSLSVQSSSICGWLTLAIFVGGLIWAGWVYLVKPWYAKPLRLLCEHCERYIGSDIEWACGYCHKINRDTKNHPHFNCCARCGSAPPGFVCMHCAHVNPLDNRRVEGHYARSAHQKPPEPADDDAARHQQKLNELMRDKELNEAMKQVAESREERLNAEARVNPPTGSGKDNGKKPKSEREKARERVKKRLDQYLGSKQAINEYEAALRKEYSADPEMLEDLDGIFDAIRHDELMR